MANREPKSTWTIRLGPVTRYGSMNEVNDVGGLNTLSSSVDMYLESSEFKLAYSVQLKS